MKRILLILVGITLCLTALTEPCLAKRRGGNRGRGRRGRGRGNPASRARQRNIQALRHHAKHTGVHTKLGQSPKGIHKIGLSSAELRKMHDNVMQNQSMRIQAPASDLAARIIAQRALEHSRSVTNAPQSKGMSFQP